MYCENVLIINNTVIIKYFYIYFKKMYKVNKMFEITKELLENINQKNSTVCNN